MRRSYERVCCVASIPSRAISSRCLLIGIIIDITKTPAEFGRRDKIDRGSSRDTFEIRAHRDKA